MGHLRHLTHYGHKNICRGASEWNDGGQNTRDFDTIEEMNQAIVDGINKRVKEDDILIHLGDWSFGGIENIWNFIKQIKCKNIHLVYGNHDHHIKGDKILPNVEKCFESYEDGEVKFINKDVNKRSWINVDRHDIHKGEVRSQDLFSSTGDVLDFTITSDNVKGKLRFICNHFPFLTWDKQSNGTIMLHGHEHGGIDNLNNNCKRLDTGIDVTYKFYKEYRPFNIKEIIQLLENKPNLKLGHH